MSEHRPIPLFARRLLPELRQFPSPAAATRSFNAIRRIVSPAPTLGYFGVMDLILLTLPVAIILVAVVLEEPAGDAVAEAENPPGTAPPVSGQ